MKIYPPEPEIGDLDGFTAENDIFGYKDFGERLANLLGNLEDSSVLLLDGDWGTGKSTFVKQSAGLMRQRGFPVIHFDAFASDFQEDAFIALSCQILVASKAVSKRQKKPFIDKTKILGAGLMPVLTKAAIHLGTAGAMDKDQQDKVVDTITAAFSSSQGALEEIIGVELEQAERRMKAVEEFRKTLSGLAEKLAVKAVETAKEKGFEEVVEGAPLIFIVDELDRCRPGFAIEVLEKIKHIFSTENVHFLLVANMDPLANSLVASGMTREQGRRYLEKFFQLKFNLPRPLDARGFGRSADTLLRSKYINYIWEKMELKYAEADLNQSIREGLTCVSEVFGLSLRSIERIAVHLALVKAATNKRNFRIPCIVVGLCVMRLEDPDLYRKAKDGSLSWKEASEFFQFENWQAETVRPGWYKDWWKFSLEGKVSDPSEIPDFSNTLAPYGMDPKEIIPRLAEYIEDFVVVSE